MALTMSTITGRVPVPDDTNARYAEIMFELTGFDTEAEAVILPGSRRVMLEADGSLPAGFELWQNVNGLRATSYTVSVNWVEPHQRSLVLGRIYIGDLPSYALSDLLNAGTLPVAPNTYWSAITQADYDQMEAWNATAVAAAAAAETAYDSMWAFNIIMTRAQVQAHTAPFAVGYQMIPILESGFIVWYVRTAFATDLVAGDFTTWKKSSFTVADAVAIGTEVANSTVAAATALKNIPDGSAAEPGFKFTLDPDTGFFRIGDNSMGISTAGVQRVGFSEAAMQIDVPVTGSAAQSSSSDAGANKLLKTGAFGLGAKSAITVINFDSILVTGFYSNSAIAVGAPIANSLYWTVEHISHSSDGTSSQFAMRSAGVSANQMYFRRKAGGVWSAWDKVFHSGNLLGTVSQTGGLPTGAVIERGSNANGNYVKFADGTLQCSFSPATFVYSTADLVLFTWNFPVPFLTGTLPSISAVLSSAGADYTGLSRRDCSAFACGPGTAGAVLSFTRPSGATRSFTVGDQIANVRLNATGRWF